MVKKNYQLQPTNTVCRKPHQIIIKVVKTESTIADNDQVQ